MQVSIKMKSEDGGTLQDSSDQKFTYIYATYNPAAVHHLNGMYSYTSTSVQHCRKIWTKKKDIEKRTYSAGSAQLKEAPDHEGQAMKTLQSPRHGKRANIYGDDGMITASLLYTGISH